VVRAGTVVPGHHGGRNVVERCFNKLKQWRGLAMRSDRTARNYHSFQRLAATLHWLTSSLSNTA
jgi:transposase